MAINYSSEAPDLELINALKSKNRLTRLNAAKSLKGTTHPEAVAALCAALDDWYAPVREACAEALSGNSDPKVILALAQGTRDDSPEVRRACAGAVEGVDKRAA